MQPEPDKQPLRTKVDHAGDHEAYATQGCGAKSNPMMLTKISGMAMELIMDEARQLARPVLGRKLAAYVHVEPQLTSQDRFMAWVPPDRRRVEAKLRARQGARTAGREGGTARPASPAAGANW